MGQGVRWNLPWFDGHTERGLQYPGRCVMPPRKYKTFSKAFKEEAVRLLEQSGRPAADVARELGIRLSPFPFPWQAKSWAK